MTGTIRRECWRRHHWLAVALVLTIPSLAPAQLSKPGTAPAVGPDAPQPTPTPSTTRGVPQPDTPIVPEAEFDAALPPLSGDINAPLETMPATTATPPATSAPSATMAPAPVSTDALAPVTADPQLAQPLQPLSTFDTVPLETAADVKDKDAPDIHYETVIKGLDDVDLKGRWEALSALRNGHGKAGNATQVSARAHEDEALAVRLMKSLGYYDGTASSVIEATPKGQKAALTVTVSATPGTLYKLGAIAVQTQPTTPPNLVREQLPLRTGDPVEAGRIQGAEANVALQLPQRGYPFVKVGQRDILLDEQSFTGDYTLPVDTGPRSSFGGLQTEGDPVFSLKHLNVFPRFDRGDLFDKRKQDDLRDALTATGVFSTVSVTPVDTGKTADDGTEIVDLMVRQALGKIHSLGGSAGYATGQGITLTGSYTNRNAYPPEGALILTAVAGTQEQGASATFRRANAGRRDRTFSAIASADHSNFDAFNAFTATLAVRWSYDSTPIWQKRFTYAYGAELVGTNESVYDFDAGETQRRTYGILAVPLQVGFDTSDDLLNPTRGYRLTLSLSPETSVQGSVRPYARVMVQGTYYYPTSPSLVIAGRVRVGTIQGAARDDLAPSRRYYGGGGGSVRGYGYQRLGPLDPNGDPVGGRSLNEFSLEARYRFGNFGIVPFFDAGNAYESSFPQFSSLRYGAGIGGRFYTNFGPLRADIAHPLNGRKGDGVIALYISIGQAF